MDAKTPAYPDLLISGFQRVKVVGLGRSFKFQLGIQAMGESQLGISAMA